MKCRFFVIFILPIDLIFVILHPNSNRILFPLGNKLIKKDN